MVGAYPTSDSSEIFGISCNLRDAENSLREAGQALQEDTAGHSLVKILENVETLYERLTPTPGEVVPHVASTDLATVSTKLGQMIDGMSEKSLETAQTYLFARHFAASTAARYERALVESGKHNADEGRMAEAYAKTMAAVRTVHLLDDYRKEPEYRGTILAGGLFDLPTVSQPAGRRKQESAVVK